MQEIERFVEKKSLFQIRPLVVYFGTKHCYITPSLGMVADVS